MRKCKFKKLMWYERTESELQEMYDKLPEYDSYKSLRGTGFDGYKRNNKKYQKMTTLYGYFHQFGTDIVEDPDAGNVQFTTAVIEDSHGSLHNVSIEDVEFLPDDSTNSDYREHNRIFGW